MGSGFFYGYFLQIFVENIAADFFLSFDSKYNRVYGHRVLGARERIAVGCGGNSGAFLCKRVHCGLRVFGRRADYDFARKRRARVFENRRNLDDRPCRARGNGVCSPRFKRVFRRLDFLENGFRTRRAKRRFALHEMAADRLYPAFLRSGFQGVLRRDYRHARFGVFVLDNGRGKRRAQLRAHFREMGLPRNAD